MVLLRQAVAMVAEASSDTRKMPKGRVAKLRRRIVRIIAVKHSQGPAANVRRTAVPNPLPPIRCCRAWAATYRGSMVPWERTGGGGADGGDIRARRST